MDKTQWTHNAIALCCFTIVIKPTRLVQISRKAPCCCWCWCCRVPRAAFTRLCLLFFHHNLTMFGKPPKTHTHTQCQCLVCVCSIEWTCKLLIELIDRHLTCLCVLVTHLSRGVDTRHDTRNTPRPPPPSCVCVCVYALSQLVISSFFGLRVTY